MHVRDIRNKLKQAYCVGVTYSGCNNIGKRRILKYAERASDDPDQYYQKFIAPKIEKALDVPVVLKSMKKMSPNQFSGVFPMAYFLDKKEIGVFNDLPYLYKKKYKTQKGFDKYMRYVLAHEFAHSIDDALKYLSLSKKYRSDIEKVARGGKRGRTAGHKYFQTKTDYGISEIFAEFSTIQDYFNRPFTIEDVKDLCYIKHKYQGGDRISWKENRKKTILQQAEEAKQQGDSGKHKELLKKAEQYNITELDFRSQSPAVQNFLNCDDHADTLARLKSVGLHTDKA